MNKRTHNRMFGRGSDMAVLKPFRVSGPAPGEGLVLRLLNGRVALALLSVLLIWMLVGEARAQIMASAEQTVLDTLIKWTPLILLGPPGELGGFVLNVIVSFLAMAMGTFMGIWLGLGQVSLWAPVRRASWVITQLFRNSPWLVLLFYFMLMLPFQIKIFGVVIPVEGWVKATFALSLPIMANISEIVRGSIQSIPSGQWESAESLAFSRYQTLWMIILPQCVKRMIPPWMNWYAILTMSTPLISILGVADGMSLTQDALAAEGRSEYLIPMYLWLMSWFFIYCYTIARWTISLERRFQVNI